MTPAEFVAAVREMHEPYMLELIEIVPTDPTDNNGEVRPPTMEERDAAIDLWCDGCYALASKCRVQHLLALVED